MIKTALNIIFVCDFCGLPVTESGMVMCSTPWKKIEHVAKAHICLDCARIAVEALEKRKQSLEGGAK